jgi:hypothetical protein
MTEAPTISAISPSPALGEGPTISAIAQSPALGEGPTISVVSSAPPLAPLVRSFPEEDTTAVGSAVSTDSPLIASDPKDDTTSVSAVMEISSLDDAPNVHEDPTVHLPPGADPEEFAAERARLIGRDEPAPRGPTTINDEEPPTIQVAGHAPPAPQAPLKPQAPLPPRAELGATPGGDRTQDVTDGDILDDPSVIKKPIPSGGSMPRAQKTLVGLNDLPTKPVPFGVVPLDSIGASNVTPHPPFELLDEPMAGGVSAATVPGGARLVRRQNRIRMVLIGTGAFVGLIGIGVVLKLALGGPTGSTALPPPTAAAKTVTTAASEPAQNDTSKADPSPNDTTKADPAPADKPKNDQPAADDSASPNGWSGSAPAPIAATPAPAPRPAAPRPQATAAPAPAPRPAPQHTASHASPAPTTKSTKGGIVRDTPF